MQTNWYHFPINFTEPAEFSVMMVNTSRKLCGKVWRVGFTGVIYELITYLARQLSTTHMGAIYYSEAPFMTCCRSILILNLYGD